MGVFLFTLNKRATVFDQEFWKGTILTSDPCMVYNGDTEEKRVNRDSSFFLKYGSRSKNEIFI